MAAGLEMSLLLADLRQQPEVGLPALDLAWCQ
jgi:hypothetical protein